MRTTSMTVTKMPSANVSTRMIFCRRGSRMLVSTGMGKTKMARSVVMLTGDEQMNSVSRGMHESDGTLMSQAERIGEHWKMFMNVKIVPETLTTISTATEPMRSTTRVFLDSLR